MRFVAHEHPPHPSARQGPHRAGEEVQRGVRRVVIVAKDGAVDPQPNVIPVRERTIRPRESEKQCRPSGEQQKSREGLVSPRPAHDEIGKEIGEGNLGKNVDQLRLDLAGGNPDEDLAQDDEMDGARQHVTKIFPRCGAQFYATGHGERHGRADHKHEGGLNHVPKHAAFPGHMLEPVRDPAPGGITR